MISEQSARRRKKQPLFRRYFFITASIVVVALLILGSAMIVFTASQWWTERTEALLVNARSIVSAIRSQDPEALTRREEKLKSFNPAEITEIVLRRKSGAKK